jgi:hypothetical protein
MIDVHDRSPFYAAKAQIELRTDGYRRDAKRRFLETCAAAPGVKAGLLRRQGKATKFTTNQLNKQDNIEPLHE